jgi:DNA polymerase III subunit epsilon
MSVDFVVVDFETTGILPKNDRVIEIGAIRTSESGKILDQFTSLVNPHRDVGPTDIHGITPGMLRDAPSFGEVLNEFAKILDGAVLVAHNASFDARFLDAELERLGHGRNDIGALCTMELMGLCYPSTVRRLVDCCEYLNLPVLDAHSAFDDAQMASNLFHALLKDVGDLELPEPLRIGAIDIGQRPQLKRNSLDVLMGSTEAYVASLLSKSKPGRTLISSDTNECQYLNILDEALSDRKLTLNEADDLLKFASMVRMSKEQVRGLHHLYLSHLFALAMEDGELSLQERSDLEHVAELLNVQDWEEQAAITNSAVSTNLFERIDVSISSGMSVCFTGTMSHSRDELEQLARDHDLLVKQGVSRILDLLVVADADSLSGKARKARDLGVQIIAEQGFLALLRAKN